MKRIFIKVALMAIVFTSCDKKEDVQTSTDLSCRQSVLTEASELSRKHDSLVIEILSACKQQVKYNVQTAGGTADPFMGMQPLFESIEAVTGVKPQVIKTKDSSASLVSASLDTDLPVFDFDQEVISLSQYVNSYAIARYFDAVDVLIQDELLSVPEKISQISEVQQEVQTDQDIDLKDYEIFMNSTEVLKGSLALWSNYAVNEQANVKTGDAMYAKPLTKWSFFAKLGFVAAADAVGAVVGTFIGSYIVINGVPVYIPAGPQGACAGLAILSVLAAKMVGW